MMKNGFIITFCALTLMTAFSCEKTEKEDNGGGGNTTPEIPEGLADLPDTIRIGTYNLRVSTDNGINSWEQRRGRLVQSIAENDFDVFGVQEADITIQSDLPQLLKAAGLNYGYRFFSPYKQTGSGDKAQGIFYKSPDFTLQNWQFFWVSDTPDECTVNDTGGNGSYRRGGCCAVMKDNMRSNLSFFFMVTHGHLNSGTNEKYAYVYEEQEKRFNTGNLPSVLVGDLNAIPTGYTSSVLRTYWEDSFMYLPEKSKSGPSGTYNGFDHNKNMETARRIDYIYFRGEDMEPLQYVCNDALYDGEFASDHFPIYVDMKISQPKTWY